MHQPELYIGLISGTSADGINGVLVDFSQPQPMLLSCTSEPYGSTLKQAIRDLMLPGNNEIDRMGVLDQQLGLAFAQAAQSLLQRAEIDKNQIRAIGSHGQTLRHRPAGQLDAAFTLQVGDPNIIAQVTGITTVADLRRRDMAAGGQGAPLAPGFHRAVFSSGEKDRVIVNIGGIGNITYLPTQGKTLGFDTGPGNALMDEWIQLHQGLHYDDGGAWAGSGTVNDALLQALLQHPYFGQPIPKSTGREEFHLPWLQSVLKQFDSIAPADVQTTLLELTAVSISRDILELNDSEDLQIFVCGGGAYNTQLMQRLAQQLNPRHVGTTSELGIDPEWIEASAFALFAKQTLEKRPSNIASVTGAHKEVILGAVYWA